MFTPWGASDYSRPFDVGIVFYGTPSHGGFLIRADREAELDAVLREVGITAEQARMGYDPGWYEEDCCANAVIVAFPDLFPEHDPDEALQSLLYWIAPPGR